MKITKQYLESIKACNDAVEKFYKVYKDKEIDSIVVLKKAMSLDHFDWANWLIVRLMSRPQYLQYAIFAAEQVIEIYEKKYPDDKRPREAIEAAKKVLENDSQENRSAAYSTNAAYSAANAAANAAAAAIANTAAAAIANTAAATNVFSLLSDTLATA